MGINLGQLTREKKNMRSLTISIALILCIIFLLGITDAPTDPPTDKSNENEDVVCMEDCMILDSLKDFEIPPILSAFLPIFFEFDKFQLSEKNSLKLEELAQYLKLKPNLKVEIQGHTDERGANNKNMVLGEKRAKAVYDFLLLSGVNKNQLSFIAYGEKAPLCQEDNEKCWDQNNRVHVVVTEKA